MSDLVYDPSEVIDWLETPCKGGDMFGVECSRKFMKIARECNLIVNNFAIIYDPDSFGVTGLHGYFHDGELEQMKELCPELFTLACFYHDGMPEKFSTLILYYQQSYAQDNPMKFLKDHTDTVINLKHSIYSWLSIPERKRIKSLAKGLVQSPGSLPPFQAAQELDQRVRRLEVIWVNKSDLFVK